MENIIKSRHITLLEKESTLEELFKGGSRNPEYSTG
jgi:hypothetical protein